MTLRGCLQLVSRKRELQIKKWLQLPTIHLKRINKCDNALDYATSQKINTFKNHIEKDKTGTSIGKSGLSLAQITQILNRDKRILELTKVLKNSSNIKNTKLTILKTNPSLVSELPVCEQFALI